MGWIDMALSIGKKGCKHAPLRLSKVATESVGGGPQPLRPIAALFDIARS
jgi:hypothetical protein